MRTKNVGSFEVEISDPAPCWISIRYSGDEIVRGLRVDELVDLRYALKRAIELAREWEKTGREPY